MTDDMSKPIPFTGDGHKETMLYFRLKIERMERGREASIHEPDDPSRIELVAGVKE